MQYHVQDPQGHDRIIEGPDGASDEEVISQAKNLFGESGGMHPVDSGLSTIRQHITPSSMAAQAVADMVPAPGLKKLITTAFPPDTIQGPQASFKQDVKTGNAQDTTLQDASTVYGIATAPSALRGLGTATDAGLEKVVNYLKSLKNAAPSAEALAPTEKALEAGLNAKDALSSELQGAKNTSKQLYDAVPQDIKVPLAKAQSTADSVINEIKDLPKEFQSTKIRGLASSIQNLDEASVPAVQAMRSTLGDIARNGEGVEKMYAARLSKALQSDLETLGQTNVVPPLSQGPSLEAQALREKWGLAASEQSGTSPFQTKPYVRPDLFTGTAAPINNMDIVNNMKKANSFYKDLATLQEHPVTQALNNARPEEMASAIFRRGNVDDVNVAKSVLGQVGYKSVSGQFYKELLDSKDIGKALGKYTPEFLDAAIGQKSVDALQALHNFKQLVAKATTGAKVGGAAIGLGGAIELGHRLTR